MDLFSQLNFRYPGSPHTARSNPSQQSRVPSLPLVQPMQNVTHPGDGYPRVDPNRIIPQTRSSIDFTVGHALQQKSTLAGVRGAVHADPQHPVELHHLDESMNLADQYIPSSSDKITCTNHRPLDKIFETLRPSLGWSQATSSSRHPSQNGPLYPHTPIRTYALSTRPQLDGVIQIPLLAVDNQISGTDLVVDFRCSDWGIGIQVEGIPMSDLLHGNVSGLESPHQRVLDGLDITNNLRLSILWPHYPAFTKVISAFGMDGKPLTRAELGYEVSLAFAEFFYQISTHSILPAQLGPYAISSSPSGSSLGIKYEQLQLITVRNTSRGEWMAEIRAVLVP